MSAYEEWVSSLPSREEIEREAFEVWKTLEIHSRGRRGSNSEVRALRVKRDFLMFLLADVLPRQEEGK